MYNVVGGSLCHTVYYVNVAVTLYGTVLTRGECCNRLEEEEERQRTTAADATGSSGASTNDNDPAADQHFLKLMNVVSSSCV